jgi:hypothetical protein
LTEVVSGERALFRVVLRDVPVLRELPQTRRAIAVFFELGRVRAARAGGELALPVPEADAWLIGRMVANALLEIAFAEGGDPDPAVLVDELARLTFRMLRARDIDAAP